MGEGERPVRPGKPGRTFPLTCKRVHFPLVFSDIKISIKKGLPKNGKPFIFYCRPARETVTLVLG